MGLHSNTDAEHFGHLSLIYFGVWSIDMRLYRSFAPGVPDRRW